jgi:hypothetical protein
MKNHNPFHYFKTSPEIIRLAVMMYVRFCLTLQKVDDITAFYLRSVVFHFENLIMFHHERKLVAKKLTALILIHQLFYVISNNLI